ncbi:hypothetical protein ACHZ98_09955 [Streptomyces sp. MAR4 CNY-716]
MHAISEADLERKFTAPTADVLDGERARAVKAAVDGLDGAPDITALTSLLETGTVSRVR